MDEKVYESIVNNQTYLQCVHKTIRLNSKKMDLAKQYRKTRDIDLLQSLMDQVLKEIDVKRHSDKKEESKEEK